MGRASSRSVLGMVGGSLALKLCRRKHMAQGAILIRSCCFGSHDFQVEDLRIPQQLWFVGPIGLSFGGRVVSRVLIFPFFQ